MMYATETVLALHRARVDEERRTRNPREPRTDRVEAASLERLRLRPTPAR